MVRQARLLGRVLLVLLTAGASVYLLLVQSKGEAQPRTLSRQPVREGRAQHSLLQSSQTLEHGVQRILDAALEQELQQEQPEPSHARSQADVDPTDWRAVLAHTALPGTDPRLAAAAALRGGVDPFTNWSSTGSLALGSAAQMELGELALPQDGFQLGRSIAAAAAFPMPTAQRYVPHRPPLALLRELAVDRKYLHEAAARGVRSSHHMDKQYFSMAMYTTFKAKPELQVTELRRLFAAWTTWADGRGVPTWLCAGTLDGWIWGQDVLPWDTDLDLRVMTSDLAWLWDTHLGSREIPLDAEKAYVLRINPHFLLPGPLQQNMIDARVVSTSTGLFIDLAGMQPLSLLWQDAYSPTAVWTNKVPDEYELDSIFPLTRTEFAGVPAWLPQDVIANTAKGNGYALTWSKRPWITTSQGYRWQPASEEDTQQGDGHLPFQGTWGKLPSRTEQLAAARKQALLRAASNATVMVQVAL